MFRTNLLFRCNSSSRTTPPI